jgi:hypothetical protein
MTSIYLITQPLSSKIVTCLWSTMDLSQRRFYNLNHVYTKLHNLGLYFSKGVWTLTMHFSIIKWTWPHALFTFVVFYFIFKICTITLTPMTCLEAPKFIYHVGDYIFWNIPKIFQKTSIGKLQKKLLKYSYDPKNIVMTFLVWECYGSPKKHEF